MKKLLILSVFVFGLFFFLYTKNNAFAAIPAIPTGLFAAPFCYPGTGTANSASGFTFSWTTMSGATSYKVSWKKSTDTSWGSEHTTSNLPTLTYPAQDGSCITGPGGCSFSYGVLINWRVRSCNSSGCSDYATGSKTSNTCTGTAPVTTPAPATGLSATPFCYPTTGTNTASGFNFSWTTVAGATSYKVSWKKSTDSNWGSEQTTTAPPLRYPPTSCTTNASCSFSYGVSIDWKVKACNSSGSCSEALGPSVMSNNCSGQNTTAPIWYNTNQGTYNTYTHIHPIPAKTGDTCTTIDAKHMCSSIPAVAANGEAASTTGTCNYISGDQVTLDGTKYTLGMSYSNYCITVPDSVIPSTNPNPTPTTTEGAASSTAKYCKDGTCKLTTDGGNCVVFSTFNWLKPSDAATNPNYKVTYSVTSDRLYSYKPLTANATTLTTPFTVTNTNNINPNGNFFQCDSTDNGNQSGTGYSCGFLQGKNVTWSIAYTKSNGALGTIPGKEFTTKTCSTVPTCQDVNQLKPYFRCNPTNNTCEQIDACGTSDCTGTNDTTSCNTQLPLCDATNSTETCDNTTCNGTTNMCGRATKSCSYQGNNCTQQTITGIQCENPFDRCSDTPGNVCQGGRCVNPNNPSPSGTATAQPTDSSNPSPSGSSSPSPSPTNPPVCNLPSLNPHFECQQNTCITVNTCAQNSGGCTRAGDNCGVPAGNTSLSFVLGLDAIGDTGDQPNPYDTYSSNQNPLRPIRNLKVEILDANYNLVLTKTGIIAYEYNSGMFLGTVDIGKTLSSGKYIVKVVSDGYLRRLIPGAQNIVAGQENNMPEVSLVVGDITQENALSILDYNILMSCSIFSADNGGACKQATGYKTLSDLEDNGVVNQFDYNLFVREYSVQNGQ